MTMDFETEHHFRAWLDANVRVEDRYPTEQKIRFLLHNYPEMILTHSWPEIRDIADRDMPGDMKATATVVKAQYGLITARILGIDRELIGRHYDLHPGDVV